MTTQKASYGKLHTRSPHILHKAILALAVAAISQFSALADGLRVMNGTNGAGTTGDGGTAAAEGNLKKAIAWSADDGGAVVTPWGSGAGECRFVIKSAQKLSGNSYDDNAFPDVDAVLANNDTTIDTGARTIEFNRLTVQDGAKGIRIIENGTLNLRGGYTISSGTTFPLKAYRSAVGSGARNITFLENASSALAGAADSVLSYSFTISTKPAEDGNDSTIVDSTLTIRNGSAAAFKGRYVIEDALTKNVNGVDYTGRAHLKFVSATAFGDPTSELFDAVTLGERAYLSIGANVAQYATRGIMVADEKKGGIEVASGDSLMLTVPVTTGTGGTFQKIGAGTATLAGDCRGVSAIEVTEGALILGIDGQFANGLAVTVKPGATLVQNKYVGNIAVTCEEGGTYVKNIHYVIPYNDTTGSSTPLDFTAAVPELPLSIRLSESIQIESFAGNGYTAKHIDVAKLPSDTTATAADFGDATEKTYGLPKSYFEMESRDGVKVLVLVAKPVVASTRDFTDADGGLNTENTPLPWSDGMSAHPGADYLLTNKLTRTGTSVFKGDSLTVGPAADKVALRYDDRENSRLDKTVVYAGVGIEPTHSSLKNAKLSGDLFLAGDLGSTEAAKCIVFKTTRAANSNMLRLDLAAELKGEGSSYLGISDNCTTGACESLELEVSGLNTNYHGVFVAMGGNILVNNVSTNSEFAHMNLVIGDARNLGGPLPEFTMDALRLTNHSMLKVKNDVTLDTENRGIYVTSKNGGFIVPNDTALTIMEKLTLQGAFYKLGAGTLALGGDIELRGGEASVGFVREGAVKALADKAVAGLGLVFSDGAAIAIDPDAAIVNGFTGDLSTVNSGEKIALRIEPRPADTRTKFTVPVCTVPTAKGDISGLFSVEHPRRYNAQLVKSTVEIDGVACTRYSVCCRRKGFAMVIR